MRIATAALLVAAVAVAVYLPALDGEFVMDDAAAIVKNADLRPSTPWRNLLKNDYWGTPIDSEASHKSVASSASRGSEGFCAGGAKEAGTVSWGVERPRSLCADTLTW